MIKDEKQEEKKKVEKRKEKEEGCIEEDVRERRVRTICENKSKNKN